MRTAASLLPVALVCAGSACARRPVVVASPGPSAQVRIARADALVRAGCLDCLIDAFAEYDRLRATPGVANAATLGAVRAALLIDLRERELGTTDEGYLQRARSIVEGHETLRAGVAPPIDVVESAPWRSLRVVRSGSDLADIERARRLGDNRAAWLDLLRRRADEDPLSATTWVWLACANAQRPAEREPDALVAPMPTIHDAPLVQYELATCGVVDDTRLDAVVKEEPRFRETDFWLGMRAIGRRQLDEAQDLLERAVGWHPGWPSALVSLGGVYLTGEDFARALDAFERALALVPGDGDALLGRLRATSYGGRYEDGIAAANDLLKTRLYPGEAYYWRAWNEAQLNRVDDAWADVESAERVWVNSEVAKLAGILAYRRHELDVARAKFEAAKSLNPYDCETLFDLGSVDADLRVWQPSADLFVGAAACLDTVRQDLRAQIATIEASRAAAERKARQIARREQQIANAGRSQVQSWFNAAVAYFNLSNKDEAKRCAEKITDDEQFGARARELLSRLR